AGRYPAHERPRLAPESRHLHPACAVGPHQHDRRLVQQDPVSVMADDSVSGPEIDSETTHPRLPPPARAAFHTARPLRGYAEWSDHGANPRPDDRGASTVGRTRPARYTGKG